jgi:DMSO/TMAO reductase YedYZ molybdopterin-dependent catalytic subunit
MKTGAASRGLTGLAAGALLAAVLLGLLALGALIGLPNVAFAFFELLVRVLPGRVVIFGLEATLRLLEGLGFDIKDTAETAEAALALMSLFVPVAVAGLLFFLIAVPAKAPRARRWGAILGLLVGVAFLVVVSLEGRQVALRAAGGAVWVIVGAVWVLGVCVAWGWALGRLYAAAYPVPAPAPSSPPGAPSSAHPPEPSATMRSEQKVDVVRLDRRHFIIRMGGLAATLVVLGAEVAQVLRVEGGPRVSPAVDAPIPFPNAASPVRPVPGTRSEYTPVPDHFHVDIGLTPRRIDGETWRLRISGLVAQPLALALRDVTHDYVSRDQFVTLACVENPIGGPLIGTTLWSGPALRDVLADARPLPTARYAHVLSDDGFDEVIELAAIQSDPRIILAHAWNGQPLTPAHGFPLRVYVPDTYGMKQPKWITEIALVADFIPGYWVQRGWEERSQVRTTAVIDTVDTTALVARDGRTYVPVGGIADAGSRGISKVEVQVDGGAWEPAQLRQPLSQLTWVIWRYEWPWQEGRHVFAVRAYDGQGRLQTTDANPAFPAGATGIDTETVDILQTS